MDITLSAFSFPLLSFEKALTLIALLDVSKFDVGLHGADAQITPDAAESDPAGTAERIRRAAESAGLRASDFFPTFGTGFRDRPVNTPEMSARKANVARFRAFVECARGIEAGGITLLPGVVWSDLGPERSFDLTVDALRELVSIAHDAGLRLSVEAHVESVAESPFLAKALVDAVSGLKLTLDYSHFVAGGYSPHVVHGLVPLAGHFHARQAGPGALQASASDGLLDFRSILSRLRNSGYAGDVCIEYTWQAWRGCDRQDTVSESVLMRDILREVLGK